MSSAKAALESDTRVSFHTFSAHALLVIVVFNFLFNLDSY